MKKNAWRKWYGRWRHPLGVLVQALGGLTSSWKSDLQTQAHAAFQQLRFSPPDLAAAFLLEHGHAIDNLEQQLDEISPSFHPVTAAPIPTAEAGWSAGRRRSGAGHGGPHRKLTTDDLIEESMARGAIGDAAERALLSWVVEDAAAQQDIDGFNDAVLSVFKRGTKTWRDVKAALERGDLEGSLYVASRWSGAGFDVLGVETVEGALSPVRYECKGISSTSPRVRVYLSRNELGVARRVHRSGPGRWMLVGVQPDGQCVDLTELIGDLLDAAEIPLEPLHDLGLEPDGLRLVVERAQRAPKAGD